MFIDIHAHAYRRYGFIKDGKQWFSTPEQLFKRYEELGIERAVLLPLVSPEFYLPQSNEEILEMVAGSLEAGGQGVSIGRNAFQHHKPAKIVAAIAKMVHKGASTQDALKLLQS